MNPHPVAARWVAGRRRSSRIGPRGSILSDSGAGQPSRPTVPDHTIQNFHRQPQDNGHVPAFEDAAGPSIQNNQDSATDTDNHNDGTSSVTSMDTDELPPKSGKQKRFKCIATKIDGQPCNNQALPFALGHPHCGTHKECPGTTNGIKCSVRVRKAVDYCARHATKPAIGGPPAPAEAVRQKNNERVSLRGGFIPAQVHPALAAKPEEISHGSSTKLQEQARLPAVNADGSITASRWDLRPAHLSDTNRHVSDAAQEEAADEDDPVRLRVLISRLRGQNTYLQRLLHEQRMQFRARVAGAYADAASRLKNVVEGMDEARGMWEGKTA